MQNHETPAGTPHQSYAMRLRKAETALLRAIRERDKAREDAARRGRKLRALEGRIRAIVSACAAADADLALDEDQD